MPLMHLWVRHAASMAYDRPIKDQVPPTIGGRSATGLPVSISKIDLLKTCISSFTSPILDMSEVAITKSVLSIVSFMMDKTWLY
jgi:hypothetical protein